MGVDVKKIVVGCSESKTVVAFFPVFGVLTYLIIHPMMDFVNNHNVNCKNRKFSCENRHIFFKKSPIFLKNCQIMFL